MVEFERERKLLLSQAYCTSISHLVKSKK